MAARGPFFAFFRWLARLFSASDGQFLPDPGSPFSAELYTRQGCHLCHVAAETLREYGFKVHEIDIDSDPELLARYDTTVPVVFIDGKERFRGRVDEVLLRRLLAGRRT